MRAEQLRAFVRRDWAKVERAKLAYWARQLAEHGPAPALQAADILRKHVLAFAGEAMLVERRQDFAYHIRAKQQIDATSAWFPS